MTDMSPNPVELLYEAALQGDVSLLQDLLLRDPLLLHRPLPPWQSNTPPLHVACKLGHTIFVKELLNRNPNLADEFDPNDKSSLLHLAVRNGHLDLVKSLVSLNPGLCFVRDMHGRTPVHVAAIKGEVDVLEALLRSMPDAAGERVGLLLDKSGGGDTVLHLCVRFNQLKALQIAVRTLGDTHILNATDIQGNTILHLAVANNNKKMVDFLLENKTLKKNTKNSNGLTAMDVLTSDGDHGGLKSTLKRRKVLSSKAVNKKEKKKQIWSEWHEKPEKQRETLMIVAVLIATMAFQAGLNPPGGFWQDTKRRPSTDSFSNALASVPAPLPLDDPWHEAGSAVMAQKHPIFYQVFLICNLVGFLLSMISILVLISGFPIRRYSMISIKTALWIAVCYHILLSSRVSDFDRRR